MLRKCWIAAAVFAAAVFAQTNNITGHWLAETTTQSGGKRDYVFFLKQDGNKLTGFAQQPNGSNQPIDVGTIQDGKITFVVMMQTANGARKLEYYGVMQGDDIKMTVPGRGNQPGTEVVAKRVSSDPTPVSRWASLPKVELPKVHPLPSNGLAKTPPMGWNSWNRFAGRIDDKTVREIADAMVSSGMQKAGYVYVNIDDTWEAGRDANGNIQTNKKFPDMKALADYVHSKGLKLGIYSGPGPRTCAGFEGSYGHEAQDAKTYASWGIDYLKYDWCSAGQIWKDEDMQAVYQKMGEALQASGRPIVYSLCQYGRDHVETWGAAVGGNLWRTTGDIGDRWASMSSIGFDKQVGLDSYAGPGHWNDPDMLEIGNGGMSDTEYRTHMSLWSLLAAPLLAGNDVRTMTPATRDILTNTEVIAIDQDPLGKEAKRLAKDGDLEVWARPLQNGDMAVGLFNRGSGEAKVTVTWQELGLSGSHKVRDLWAHADRGSAADNYSADVPSHGVVLIRIAK